MRMHCDNCRITRDLRDIFGHDQGDCPNCGAPMTGTTELGAGTLPTVVRWANVPTRQLGDALELARTANPGFTEHDARWVDHDPEIPWIADRDGHWRITMVKTTSRRTA